MSLLIMNIYLTLYMQSVLSVLASFPLKTHLFYLASTFAVPILVSAMSGYTCQSPTNINVGQRVNFSTNICGVQYFTPNCPRLYSYQVFVTAAKPTISVFASYSDAVLPSFFNAPFLDQSLSKETFLTPTRLANLNENSHPELVIGLRNTILASNSFSLLVEPNLFGEKSFVFLKAFFPCSYT